MMDVGATICTRAKPRCDACPVSSDCVARIEDRIAELPGKRARRELPHREVQVLLVERAGEVLLERRRRPACGDGCGACPRSRSAATRSRRCTSATACARSSSRRSRRSSTRSRTTRSRCIRRD
jgi:A/G-specific adenine glycosylase